MIVDMVRIWTGNGRMYKELGLSVHFHRAFVVFRVVFVPRCVPFHRTLALADVSSVGRRTILIDRWAFEVKFHVINFIAKAFHKWQVGQTGIAKRKSNPEWKKKRKEVNNYFSTKYRVERYTINMAIVFTWLDGNKSFYWALTLEGRSSRQNLVSWVPIQTIAN